MTSFWLPDETGFSYRNGALFCEDVPVAELADKYGTPSFIYSRKAIETAFRDYDGAFGSHPHHILYSVKACSNIGIISLLAKLGSGFDIVSGGELLRVEAAGGDLSKVVYSGVGKTDKEIAHALEKGIHCFNIESGADRGPCESERGREDPSLHLDRPQEQQVRCRLREDRGTL